MKKIVTQTLTKTIDACDLCERECGFGFSNACFFCNRQCCYRCSRGIEFAGDHDKRLLEFFLKVCCKCEELGEEKLAMSDRLKATLQGADKKVREIVDQWRGLAGKLKEQSNG